jgi:hypothetical protein
VLPWAVLRAAGLKIKVSGIANRLYYCIIIMVYTQFENLAGGRIMQPGGSWIEDPHSAPSSPM